MYTADSAALSLATDFTFEAWLKFEQLPSTAGSPFVLFNKQESGDISYVLQVHNTANQDKLYLIASDDGTVDATHFVQVVSENTVSAGSWFHMAVSFDISDESGQFYIDSVADTSASSGSMGASIHDSNQAFSLGCRYPGGTPERFYDGKMDEARVWSDIRTAQEVADNYNIRLSDPSSETDLQLYLPYDAGKAAGGNPMFFSGGVAVG